MDLTDLLNTFDVDLTDFNTLCSLFSVFDELADRHGVQKVRRSSIRCGLVPGMGGPTYRWAGAWGGGSYLSATYL